MLILSFDKLKINFNLIMLYFLQFGHYLMGAFVVFQKQFECFIFFAQHRAGRKYLDFYSSIFMRLLTQAWQEPDLNLAASDSDKTPMIFFGSFL